VDEGLGYISRLPNIFSGPPHKTGSGWSGQEIRGEGGVSLGTMGEGDLGHGFEWGGHAAQLGGDDLLQEGVVVGLWGPWGEQLVPGLTHQVTGHVGQTGGGEYPRRWQIYWPL